MLGKKLGTILVASTALVAAFAAPSAAAGQSGVSGQEVRVQANQVHIWQNQVAVRTARSTDSTKSKIVRRVDKGYHKANCQRTGDRVTAEGYTNTWWVWLTETSPGKKNGGWVTAVYVSGGVDNGKIPGIPTC
ncbi:hypothetical protein VM636_19865 [Streptomyces sp. SCSIO 75703]|uniref:hypothetical protein n=1 Tax=unclassified Streptomyces TaxID=2593676 RepID=UPI0004C26718|nr:MULTISPECIES: hypothetical protein [unclassified Streptomyces]